MSAHRARREDKELEDSNNFIRSGKVSSGRGEREEFGPKEFMPRRYWQRKMMAKDISKEHHLRKYRGESV